MEEFLPVSTFYASTNLIGCWWQRQTRRKAGEQYQFSNVIHQERRWLWWNPDGLPYLSDHAVPHVVDLLAVLSICDQVEVVGELDIPRYLLQNVNAEALAALLNVGTSWCAVTATHRHTQRHKYNEVIFSSILACQVPEFLCWLLRPHLVVPSKCKTGIMTVQSNHKYSWRGDSACNCMCRRLSVCISP